MIPIKIQFRRSLNQWLSVVVVVVVAPEITTELQQVAVVRAD